MDKHKAGIAASIVMAVVTTMLSQGYTGLLSMMVGAGTYLLMAGVLLVLHSQFLSRPKSETEKNESESFGFNLAILTFIICAISLYPYYESILP